MKIIGVMSGTSCDGLDLSVIEIDKTKFKIIKNKFILYPKKIKKELLSLNKNSSIYIIKKLDIELGEIIGNEILKLKYRNIKAIGLHGHTVYHNPKEKISIQIGSAHIINKITGIPVINNFREKDVIYGGQGAPLIPFADKYLFWKKGRELITLNIGGIANITVIKKDGSVTAFDTGPGNCLIDYCVREMHKKKSIDTDGRLAAKGNIDKTTLKKFLKYKYFRKSPPKSLDREDFISDLLRIANINKYDYDLLSTVTQLTINTISESIIKWSGIKECEVIVSGGGMYNKTLMDGLNKNLKNYKIVSADKYKISPDFKESIGFGILAYANLKNIPANIATGCKYKLVLGDKTDA